MKAQEGELRFFSEEHCSVSLRNKTANYLLLGSASTVSRQQLKQLRVVRGYVI
jgi:hypothetical protein